MSRPLTKTQRYFLEGFIYGWTISHPAAAHPSLRRIIARGLIAKTGVVGGRPYFAITTAGRAALEHTP